jgi:hypothetical protein
VLRNTLAQAALLPPGPFVDPLRDIVSDGRSTAYDPELVELFAAHYRERLENRPREGAPIAEVQPVPPDATAADRLAGYLGRTLEVAR